MINASFNRWRPTVITAVLSVWTLTSAGCNLSDTGMSAYRPPDQYFAVLALEHHAINLSTVAPYDTLTLHTIRAMGDGGVVPGDVTYSVSSPSIRVIDGVLKADSPVTKAVLRVKLTHGTITRTDSAFVSVIAVAPDRLRDFGLRLTAGDSAKTSVAVPKTIPLVRASDLGLNLSTLLVSMKSSDSTVASIAQSGDSANIVPKRPGRIVFSASTFAFGATWRDSLVFTVGWPLLFSMSTVERFTAGSLTRVLDFAYPNIIIGVGGCVLWQTQSDTIDIDLQFDDPAHVAAPVGSLCADVVLDPTVGGNIAPFRFIPWDGNPAHFVIAYLSPNRARSFPIPGVFPYRSSLHGTTGIVRVCDERNDTTCAPVRLGNWN